jgi:group I intron endonuclease
LATIGIYIIRNTVDDKRYVGKSINIEKRTLQHFTKGSLSGKGSRHLTAAMNKHGKDKFVVEIADSFDQLDEKLLADREVYWMDFYNTCDRSHGYNLKRDSSTRCEVHAETKKIISEITKQRLANPLNHPRYGVKLTDETRGKISAAHKRRYENGAKPHNYGSTLDAAQKQHMSSNMKKRWAAGGIYTEETIRKQCENRSKYWRNNPEAAKLMGERVSAARSMYRICQLDSTTGEVIQCWDSMLKVIENNPTFRALSIYATCDGYQKTHRGYKWKKELKNEDEVGL